MVPPSGTLYRDYPGLVYSAGPQSEYWVVGTFSREKPHDLVPPCRRDVGPITVRLTGLSDPSFAVWKKSSLSGCRFMTID